jgi:hypothetical protein
VPEKETPADYQRQWGEGSPRPLNCDPEIPPSSSSATSPPSPFQRALHYWPGTSGSSPSWSVVLKLTEAAEDLGPVGALDELGNVRAHDEQGHVGAVDELGHAWGRHQRILPPAAKSEPPSRQFLPHDRSKCHSTFRSSQESVQSSPALVSTVGTATAATVGWRCGKGSTHIRHAPCPRPIDAQSAGRRLLRPGRHAAAWSGSHGPLPHSPERFVDRLTSTTHHQRPRHQWIASRKDEMCPLRRQPRRPSPCHQGHPLHPNPCTCTRRG